MAKNMLFFFTDQQRQDSLGCYGNEICRTPAVDAVAREGVVFNRAYTPSAICSPARASLLTGVRPFLHGVLTNSGRKSAISGSGIRCGLRQEYAPFSHALHRQGYRTGSVGKWHVGTGQGPLEHGFEGPNWPGWGQPLEHPDYLAYLAEHDLPPVRLRREITSGTPPKRMAGILEQPVEATFPYFIAERALAMLREFAAGQEGGAEPFFLAVQFFGPHLPYHLPVEYAHMYDPADVTLPAGFAESFANKPMVLRHYSRHWGWDSLSLDDWRELTAMYWAFVTLIDEQVGRVLDELDRLGLTDETVVAFSADHGAFVGSHRLADKSPGMYEDIYRIPLVMRHPDGVHGAVDDRLVSLLDLPATFIDLAGGDAAAHMEGRSLMPLLMGEERESWRQAVFGEFHSHQILYPQRMVCSERYKLIVHAADISEFYDLDEDPAELHNRIDAPRCRQQRDEHLRRLQAHLEEAGDYMARWLPAIHESF